MYRYKRKGKDERHEHGQTKERQGDIKIHADEPVRNLNENSDVPASLTVPRCLACLTSSGWSRVSTLVLYPKRRI